MWTYGLTQYVRDGILEPVVNPGEQEALYVKCTKCGSEIPSQSKFCLSCGQPLATTGMPVAPAPETPQKGSPALGILAGVLVVILLAVGAVLLKGRGVTQGSIPNGRQTPVVKAPGLPTGPQADLLKSNVKNQALNLNAPQKTPPPQDVVAYLDHLKKVEDQRMTLKTEEEAALLNIIPHLQVDPLKEILDWSDNPEGSKPPEKTTEDKAKEQMKDMSADWQKLAAFFISVPAPEPCKTLATKYYDALRDVISTTADLQAILVSGDVGRAYQMQGKSGRIDDKLIAADTELNDVCTRYSIDKNFSIQSDTGVSPLMGLPTKR